MRRKINGVLYSTRKAVLIASAFFPCQNAQSSVVEEKLYKSKNNNRFFLVSIGGCRSDHVYTSKTDRSLSSRKMIIPLSHAEALDWLQFSVIGLEQSPSVQKRIVHPAVQKCP